jgi:tRNA pseudouridine55 synthase
MNRKRAKGRSLNGVLLLNKSAGMTSNAALQQAKRLFFAAKAGHTGSLDPMATGVLPICFGEATKFSQYLLDADKQYRSTFCFGVDTTTGDAEGDIIATADASGISRQQVEAALQQFIGDIEQVPSMYSAIKHQGQPLYKLARQGKEIEREARQVSVFSMDVLDFRSGRGPEQKCIEMDVQVHCSKGTYIRSLASDLGKVLGCGGHVSALHRVATSEFNDEDALTLDQLIQERGEQSAEVLDHHLLPMDTPVNHLPALELHEQSSYYFLQGQAVMDPRVFKLGAVGQLLRIFEQTHGAFVGVGEITDDGRVAPKRLVVSSP